MFIDVKPNESALRQEGHVSREARHVTSTWPS